jgi:predicted phage terminase large subunit-like protein
MTEPTEAQRKALAALARKELCRRSLAEFAKQAWKVLEPVTKLEWGWALDAICAHLEAVTEGRIKRLVINVPPGTMKSLLIAVIWPAWEWGPRGMPEKRFISTAHKEGLALRDNMKCRRLIQSDWYQSNWPLKLTGDQNAKGKFENACTGFREAIAFRGITGSRGDRVIIDDPHSVSDANSPAVLAGDVMLFREAIPTRINNDDSAIVIVMQRLNASDISAAAVKAGYECLCIPMRFEINNVRTTSIGWSDPRTVDGELMFPERFSEARVSADEAIMGSYAVAGQFQQRPAPRDGGMFKRAHFEVVGAHPAGMTFVRDWDLAGTIATPGADPDWTVGLKMGRDQKGFHYIVDVVRLRGSAHEVETTILNTARQDGTSVTVSLKQDPGQAGKAQAAALVRMLAGYVVVVETETGSKIVRAGPLSAQAEAGNIKLVDGPWVTEFLDEIEVFPAGKHDDQVDAAASAFNVIAANNGPARWLAMMQQVKDDRQEAAKT